MEATQPSSNVRDHGIATRDGKRAKCNYCNKQVSGFSRLKQHLGGVRGDVVPCEKVPEAVKLLMWKSILEKRENTLSREVLNLYPSNVPDTTRKRKRIVTDPVQEEGVKESTSSQEVLNTSHTTDYIRSQVVTRCIARFFVENNIEFTAVNSPSFQNMVDAILECGSAGFQIPCSNELGDCMVKDEMKDVQDYVQRLRESWKISGCTILLDGWQDETEKSFINFIVDCPEGPMFLKCADVTESLYNANAMMSLLEEVLEEVGIENVVQIITYTTFGCMVEVGKELKVKHKGIFWTVCASHCINLMLEKIGSMVSIEKVMGRAKQITRLIYNDEELLRLVRQHIQGSDIVISSRIKSVIPYLTLENIVCESNNLQVLFGSPMWKSSKWASTSKGKRIAEIVEDFWFWKDCEMVLKATIPLVNALLLINGGNENPQVPYIYETIDQVKETIQEGFPGEERIYLHFWKMIDDIWNNVLHSHLHSAGYYLNPALFDSSCSFTDPEVVCGLLYCIVGMAGDQDKQVELLMQLEDYRFGHGGFAEDMALEQIEKVPPATWWSLYGTEYPDLQKFAIRILSQNCSVSRYEMKRSLPCREGINSGEEQHRLNEEDMYLQHNLHLMKGSVFRNETLEIDRESDWIFGEVEEKEENKVDSYLSKFEEEVIRRGIAHCIEIILDYDEDVGNSNKACKEIDESHRGKGK